MKIGFVNIYSFRPHVEHLYYLSLLMRHAGHEIYSLTCDANVSSCYPRLLKGTGKLVECSKCIVGGIRSYSIGNVTSFSKKVVPHSLSADELYNITLSSSCTLNRTETDNEWNDSDVVSIRNNLNQAVTTAYQSALSWINENQLDAVVCFNGRMDMTRAITYACEKSNIPYLTHERTWFADGLLLTPNANCLSLKSVGEMVEGFESKALTSEQAYFAGRLIGERFLQQNTLEWRLYNKEAVPIAWPTKPTGKKVLVLPSSRNEFAGNDEWKSGWTDNTKALDDLFEALSIKTEDVVVRFHPNWSEKIGEISGNRALTLYTQWAKKNNIHFISSEEKENTYDLIQQADIVVLNGGSSAVEAGACGKQVICLGPSTYGKAGFLRVFLNKDEMYQEKALNELDAETIIKKTLRFVYLRAKRLPQYVDYVKAVKTTQYKYFDGADSQRLLDMIITGKLLPDDDTFAKNEDEENTIVNLLKNRRWQMLADYESTVQIEKPLLTVQRKFGLRWIDRFRAKLALGDR